VHRGGDPMSLPPEDRARIEAVPFDPRATAAYNEITGALAWSDELPEGLSPAGHAYIRDLLGVRGYLHRGLPVDRAGWEAALASGLRWNGFRRVTLSADQRALLDRYVEDDSEL
jgi:hypothetical protein